MPRRSIKGLNVDTEAGFSMHGGMALEFVSGRKICCRKTAPNMAMAAQFIDRYE